MTFNGFLFVGTYLLDFQICDELLSLDWSNGQRQIGRHSLTLEEEPLHDGIIIAINSIVKNNRDFIEAFKKNVIGIISGYYIKDIQKEYGEEIELFKE